MENQDQRPSKTGQTGIGGGQPAEAVKPGDGPVRLVNSEVLPDLTSLILIACDNELPSAPELEGDEQLIDYNSSPDRMSLGDN
jgi:hypothetical protein